MRFMMKNIHQWFSEYEVSHKNPTNVIIHKIMVPAIVYSIIGLLWTIKVSGYDIPLALPFCGAIWLYYLVLSPKLSVGMFIEVGLMLTSLWYIERNLGWPIFNLSLAVFVVAWIFQFIGHKIEGKKPSFFQDIVFLLVGPLWTLNFFYKKMGIKI